VKCVSVFNGKERGSSEGGSRFAVLRWGRKRIAQAYVAGKSPAVKGDVKNQVKGQLKGGGGSLWLPLFQQKLPSLEGQTVFKYHSLQFLKINRRKRLCSTREKKLNRERVALEGFLKGKTAKGSFKTCKIDRGKKNKGGGIDLRRQACAGEAAFSYFAQIKKIKSEKEKKGGCWGEAKRKEACEREEARFSGHKME